MPRESAGVTVMSNKRVIRSGATIQLVPKGRALVDIERDIAELIKVERKNIFKMGALLIEAKAKVAHGDWLPWLAQHFQRSISTAENYMSAARYLAKFPTVGNLKLHMGAIYWLESEHTRGLTRYGVKFGDAEKQIQAAIFERAKTEWVGKAECEGVFVKIAKK